MSLILISLLLLAGVSQAAHYATPAKVTLTRGDHTYLSCEDGCTVDVTLCYYGKRTDGCISAAALSVVKGLVGEGVDHVELSGTDEVFVGTCRGVDSEDLFVEYRCKC
eukprot:sb/3477604/